MVRIRELTRKEIQALEESNRRRESEQKVKATFYQGYAWTVVSLVKIAKAGQRPLKLTIEIARLAKQGLEFTGYKGLANGIQLFLIPCMALRSLYFVHSGRFSPYTSQLFGTPEDRKNFIVSFLSLTTLASPFVIAAGWRTKEEFDYITQMELGILRIFSFEAAVKNIRDNSNSSEKVPYHVRVLDAVRGASSVSMLCFSASQAPMLMSVLGVLSFSIGVYTLSYPLVDKIAERILRNSSI